MQNRQPRNTVERRGCQVVVFAYHTDIGVAIVSKEYGIGIGSVTIVWTPYLLIGIALAAMLLVGCGAEQAMKKGDKFYALGEYYDASAQYKKAYAQLPLGL